MVEGQIEGFDRARFVGIPASFSSPYGDFSSDPADASADAPVSVPDPAVTPTETAALHAAGVPASPPPSAPQGGPGMHYSGDMQRDCETYAQMLVRFANAEQFDVIHAHDWMTYPAGHGDRRRSRASRLMMAHIHSTEFDRSGANVNQRDLRHRAPRHARGDPRDSR